MLQAAEGRNWDDYILVSQDGDGDGDGDSELPPAETRTAPLKAAFHDPLTVTTSGSSSPEEGSTHSKDSDFTIVNPADL